MGERNYYPFCFTRLMPPTKIDGDFESGKESRNRIRRSERKRKGKRKHGF